MRDFIKMTIYNTMRIADIRNMGKEVGSRKNKKKKVGLGQDVNLS